MHAAHLETVSGGHFSHGGAAVTYGAGGALFLGQLFMILFRQKYPRWWFDWIFELQRFTNRVVVFLALMDDRYPSTDEQQSVHLDYAYPDASRDLNRWLPLVKWFLDFVEGVLRWTLRVVAYPFLLVTDAYPPFHLVA